jgi:hypothetical protein
VIVPQGGDAGQQPPFFPAVHGGIDNYDLQRQRYINQGFDLNMQSFSLELSCLDSL